MAVLVGGRDAQRVPALALDVDLDRQRLAVQEEVGDAGADGIAGHVPAVNRLGGEGLLHLVEGSGVALQVAVVVGDVVQLRDVEGQPVRDTAGERTVASP